MVDSFSKCRRPGLSGLKAFFPDVDDAWHLDSVLYLVISVSCHFTYEGETCHPMRRAEEYASRIAQGSDCSTPQLCFLLLWRNCNDHSEIAWRLSHWILIPLAYGAPDGAERLHSERHMIRTLQLQRNPPLVHGRLRRFNIKPQHT